MEEIPSQGKSSGIRALWVLPNRERGDDRKAVYQSSTCSLSDLKEVVPLPPNMFLGIPGKMVDAWPDSKRKGALFSQYILAEGADYFSLSMFCGQDIGGRPVALTLILEITGIAARTPHDLLWYTEAVRQFGISQLIGEEAACASKTIERIENITESDERAMEIRDVLSEVFSCKEYNRKTQMITSDSLPSLPAQLDAVINYLKRKSSGFYFYNRFSSHEVAGITDSDWTKYKSQKKRPYWSAGLY